MNVVKYASIAIVELGVDGRLLIESLSITHSECALSGAWTFDPTERESIEHVLFGKPIVSLSPHGDLKSFIGKEDLVFLEVNEFVMQAKAEVDKAHESYADYKAEDPIKRKNVMPPYFFNWPNSIDIVHASESLRAMGRLEIPLNTPPEMQRLIPAAHLLKLLIDKWHSDEQERANRKYVDNDVATFSILPHCWLKYFVV